MIMGANRDNVANYLRAIDVLIETQNLQRQLDDDKITELIQQAESFLPIELSDQERDTLRRNITTKYQIYNATPGRSILADYDQVGWYDDAKLQLNDTFFWTRYKNYLIDQKGFAPNIVSSLGEETLDQRLMNYILNPKEHYSASVLRKGLVIGDVQSGKTSTYIGFICKAADAGYKVFILLTGTIESLRRQTQERVEEGFIGIDMTADDSKGRRVGVGEDNAQIRAAAVTSRNNDFAGSAKSIPVTLEDMNAVVFVVKKQKNVLTNLIEWLTSLNADPATGKINLPMLMIDDEADNASINTGKDKEDPTTINRLIRELANVFTVSNYVGFTATPFANVFIDPETTEKMTTQDLFPEDFIFALPTPNDYIGPQSIFAKDGQYHSQIIYINDAGREEEDGFPFYFKHKKEWEGELPGSLTDAIYTFYLANAIRDLRGDYRAHRSMLINISRFIKVQKYIQSQVEEIHSKAYRSIKFNLNHDFDSSMRDPTLKRIYHNWEEQYQNEGFTWDEIVDTLLDSIEKIQIKVVNSSKKSNKLEYPQNESLRVIAIGGLALSRGLTLEGLVVSYFFRNTCTYDVLMQMGRWFGYRRGYETLFRIWTHYSSAEWYAEIADATDQLKQDMDMMYEYRSRPRDFGIRVRNDAKDLDITAPNKMRNAKDEMEIFSYFGGHIETPYLHFNPDIEKQNFELVTDLITGLLESGFEFNRHNGRLIIQNVPKSRIYNFIKKLKIPKYSTSFNPSQIAQFLINTDDPSIVLFDIAFIEGGNKTDSKLQTTIAGQKIAKVARNNCIIDHDGDRLSIGRKGKLGGPSDGLTGIIDYNGETADSIIASAKEQYCHDYEKDGTKVFKPGTVYPSNTWFKYVKHRKPILLIYLVDINYKKDEKTQSKQIDEFKSAMDGVPVPAFALGFPQNDNAKHIMSARYKVNGVYNWFEQDEILAEGDEE